MNIDFPVLKDEERQQPIPLIWRKTISAIVDRLSEGDFDSVQKIDGVRPITALLAQRIAWNIAAYGVRLGSLRERTWQTSACQWMGCYWDVLMDLCDAAGKETDLALSLKVLEEGRGYVFEVQSVHVP